MRLFITGGSRGIGRNIVLTALKKGHDVAYTYCTPETDVEKLKLETKQIAPNGKCEVYQLDVRKSSQVVTVVDKVIDDFETIDAVINNAGINRTALTFNMSDEDWDDVIQTNLTGAFYVIRQFLPIFLSNKTGRFISMSSITHKGMSGQANYSASKAGLIGLSSTIAKEYGQKGITSNVIAPGFFETDMTDTTMSAAMKSFWIQHCPARRMGKLEELSELALFLSSDEAGFINGQTIYINGGLDWAD